MAEERRNESPFAPDDVVIKQLRDMGAPAEVIERAELAMGKPIAYDLEVAADVESSLNVFRLMGTQWNVAAGFAGTRYVGLRYESLPFVMRFAGIQAKRRNEVFADVRIMEAAAMNVLNARK